ncbi:phosphatase [Vibrio tubiashii]|nr:phosphatase [Vibrio tubiashii]
MSYVPLNISKIKAIVFDLDNTLVSSDMDFHWLREQVGCPSDKDLLVYVKELACERTTEKANALILQHELDDAQASQPMPGCHSLLDFIHANQLQTAIITRNCVQASKQKVSHNKLRVPRIITREHFPPKPAPDALVSLANEWRLQRDQVLYVGDYLYDLEAAFNANMPSCLVTHGKPTEFSAHASLVVDHLYDLEREFISALG